MNSKKKIFFISLIFLLSCTGDVGNLITGLPKKKLNLSEVKPASAESCGFLLLWFIPIDINERHKRAVSQLTSQYNPDKEYLADISVEENWGWRFIGTSYCTILKGKIYKYE